jgi:hypothetical protein
LFDKEVNSNYYWQAQGYLWLTGLSKAKICHVLTDTPLHLIQKEAYWRCKEMGYEELDLEIYNEYVKKMTYKDIPDDKKIKIFDVERNEIDIELIQHRVFEARKYIQTL